MSSPVGRTVRLKSAARHIYAGRLICPNDEFMATEQDAEDLIALHFAVRVPEYSTAALLNQDVKAGAVHVKRTYRRRDLKAEN